MKAFSRWMRVNSAGGGRDALDGGLVRVNEVCMRDGLQNEKIVLNLPDKLELLKRLCGMNPYSIEVTSFVRGDLVPQLADHKELCKEMFTLKEVQDAKRRGMKFSGLVPNRKGLDAFLTTELDTLVCLTSATNSHSLKNVNKDMKTSLKETREMIEIGKKEGKRVHAYVSMAFICPYEDEVEEDIVVDIAKTFHESQADLVVLSDTLGKGKKLFF